jgi:hypothetical protein
MPHVYIYVVDRDFGFAPNPFHGRCTLATCKPIIRRVAQEGDWILGMGGARLNATGRCVFSMKISRKITFNEYWSNPLYRDKKPVRNGSRKMIVGDNIYHTCNGAWQQANSHHSYLDGSQNPHNVKNDTQTDAVLVSDYFFYFGASAVTLPSPLLDEINYRNGRNHRKLELSVAHSLISFFVARFPPNRLIGDPFDFGSASARYSAENNKVTKST